MLWKINFVVDNGYYHEDLVCIVVALNKLEAKEVFKKWISPLLHNDDYIVEEIITPIDCSNGIVYSDIKE